MRCTINLVVVLDLSGDLEDERKTTALLARAGGL
jgi:hypothetical protein